MKEGTIHEKHILNICNNCSNVIPAIALDANNHIEPSPETDCVESTLGTATGPANLEADWTANTINLEWYNEDTKLTVPTTSNTCTYDGGITLPSTNPTKAGYTFKGWQVRNAQCSLSNLDASIGTSWDATHCRWKTINDGYGTAMQSALGTENNSDLDNGEWAVTFSYGTVKGVALCSSTSGSYHEIGSPNKNAEGENCWCKAISYASENQNFCNVSSSPWVLGLGYSNADSCKHDCAYNCAGNIQSGSQSTTNYRRVLYGITQ